MMSLFRKKIPHKKIYKKKLTLAKNIVFDVSATAVAFFSNDE